MHRCSPQALWGVPLPIPHLHFCGFGARLGPALPPPQLQNPVPGLAHSHVSKMTARADMAVKARCATTKICQFHAIPDVVQTYLLRFVVDLLYNVLYSKLHDIIA